jgi:hypothetical protein
MKSKASAFVLVLLSLVMLACGTGTTTPTGGTTILSEEEAQLLGAWETVSRGTDWVDNLSYDFRPDGTFSYVARKAGTTTGTEQLRGRFHIEGDRLVLTDLRDTWIDSSGSTDYQDREIEDRRVWFEFSGGVLSLNGEAYDKP